MKKKKVMSLLLAAAVTITLVPVPGMIVKAKDKDYLAINGETSQTYDVDNINTVNPSKDSINIYNNSDENKVNVKNNISNNSGRGILIANNGGGTSDKNEITVGGNISTQGAGIVLNGGDGNSVTVGGNISTQGTGIALNDADGNSVTVAGNVTSSGTFSDIYLGTNVTNTIITVGGDLINAGQGVAIDTGGKKNNIHIDGDVKSENGSGILDQGSGDVISVGGSVYGDNSGINLFGENNVIFVQNQVSGEQGTAVCEDIWDKSNAGSTITILGAANGNIMVGTDSNATDVDTELAKVGNIIVDEIITSDGASTVGVDTTSKVLDKTALANRVSTEKIYYIVNTEKLDNGTITITTASNVVEVKDADGNVLKDNNGKTLYAANRSNTVTVKIEVASGYEVKSASGGKATLTKNADGSYTLTIPDGGGVDISAVIGAIVTPTPEPTPTPSPTPSSNSTSATTPVAVYPGASISLSDLQAIIKARSNTVTSNYSGSKLNNWDQITQAISTSTLNTQAASGGSENMLQADIGSSSSKTLPTNVVNALKTSSGVKKLHVFLGESDAVTFDAAADLSNYQDTNFEHKDTVTNRSRVINFTSKQNIGAKVLLHTTVPKTNAEVKVYKMVNGNKELLTTLNSNEKGALCFPITETAEYVLEY